MSLTTFSSFYYDFEVQDSADTINKYLDFDEGGPEFTAAIAIGSHTATDLELKVKTAMDAVGGQAYTISFSRANRTYTISAASNFTLRISSGSSIGSDIFSLLGFTGANRTGSNSYTGNAIAGAVYDVQFILQDHIASANSQRSVEATVRKSASGQIEIVRFGTESFVQMNLKYITDKTPQDNVVIKANSSGVSDLQAFMQFITTKGPVEYMADSSSPSTYETLILERTSFDRKGLGYELKEMYDRGLPGYFETGILRFRVR